MDHIKELSPYGKFLLLALVAMAIIFAVVYPITLSREGYLYQGEILVPSSEGGNTVYTTRVSGEQWRFTVTADKVVTFHCGDKEYGPYRAKKDSSAIPTGRELEQHMTGVELRRGDEIIFRGGIYDTGTYRSIYNEDGTPADITVAVIQADGTMVDGDGNIVDPMEPSVGTILEMMEGPELTSRGHGGFWFLGAFLSVNAAAYILFADELFRRRYRFRVRNPEDIQPSDWELTMRPVGWTVSVLCTMAIYIMGLNIGT
jgi:hypothetical protein